MCILRVELYVSSPAEVVLFPTVSHSALSLLHIAKITVHQERVKGIFGGCGQCHSLTTPRSRTPPDVGVGIDECLDVKIEKSLSHFTRHHTLNHILDIILLSQINIRNTDLTNGELPIAIFTSLKSSKN